VEISPAETPLMTYFRYHPGVVTVVAGSLSILIATWSFIELRSIAVPPAAPAFSSGADPDWFAVLLPWRCPDPLNVMLSTFLWQLYFAWLVAAIALLAELRRARAVPASLLAAMTEAVRAGNVKTAGYLARLDRSLLGQVLTAGLLRLDDGLEEARAAGFRAALGFKESKERQLIYLEMIGTLGPLVGLAAAVHAALLLAA
jgi:hypothetical protein